MSDRLSRRTFVKSSLVAPAGLAMAGAAGSAEAKETPKRPAKKGTLPVGKIGDLEVSRILLGGNLLTHYTHSRDLKYVYNLAKHYNTKEKIFETMAEAEANGINTLVIHTADGVLDWLQEYREKHGGKMQWIICSVAPCDASMGAYTKSCEMMADAGVDAIYLWGVRGDQLTKQKKFDLMKKAVVIAKSQGVPSGVGAHELDVVKACEEHDVPADFYIKTLHHHNYPSSKLDFDSMWSKTPEETIAFMEKVDKPWIGFKVMAAGAIPPKDAFRYAFKGGCDFSLAGMFDYEIEEDARIAREVLAMEEVKGRTRPWRG